MALEDFRMGCRDRSGQVSGLSTEQGFNRIESLQGIIEKPVMSVELAMKRELMYRRKMEMLQLERRRDSNKAPMPSQVACSSGFNLKQHREGQKHKAKLKELEESQKNGGEKVSKPEWCELCRIPCMNALSLEQHLTGKKHAARLQAIQDAERAIEEEAAATKVKWEEMVLSRINTLEHEIKEILDKLLETGKAQEQLLHGVNQLKTTQEELLRMKVKLSAAEYELHAMKKDLVAAIVENKELRIVAELAVRRA
ncbi:hypothetical protein HHK36_032110 [Tetracentron sinense]|uniref:U1-type domain-containing protein n=1 Tax=Tetracentron sinense TaxID=13715 RepID=A0A834Y7V2_TETSI|nr:hypothetical protein HHK36_032110 [Tetracentron sinense]